MAATARRLNFMIKAELADEFEAAVPAGMRSKVVNEALARELDFLRRKKATEKLKGLRKKTPFVPTEEIVKAVRADRERR